MAIFSSIRWGSPARREDFISWLRREIYQAEGDREDLERTWEDQILQWRSKMTDESLDYPYPGASNIELPITDMHTTPVLADFLQSFHATDSYWHPVAKRPDRVDSASALREGMTALEKKYLKMRRVNERAFLENGILGTAFYKNGWRSERRADSGSYRPDGEYERRIRFISEPRINHVPIQRVWFPAYAWDLDFDAPGGTPWIAEEHRWSRMEFETFRRGSAELPGFDSEAVSKVEDFFTMHEDDVSELQREENEFEPFEDIDIRIFEVWARFDVQGDNVYEDIQVLFHPETGEILRGIYFPNAHGRHPFHDINYLPGYGVYGIGLAEVDEWAQEAATQLLNAQIDNARLANTRMFKAPQGSMHSQDELVYPGKVWYLGPDEDIGEVRLSEVYPSGFQLIQNLVQFAEMRSGVSELRQGSLNGLPSRTPATSLLSILQEGNKRFDMIHAGVRDVHSEMGLRMLQNTAQRAKDDPFRWQGFFSQSLGPEDARRVMEILTTPNVEEIEEAFGIEVSATSARVNKEVEKQSFVGMLQIAQQIYGSLIQTMMLYSQVPDEAVKATAAASFIAGVDILGQLFDRFDVQNKDEYMGQLEAVSQSLQQQGAAQGAEQNPQAQALMQQLGLLGGAQGIPPQGLPPNALSSLFGVG